MKSDTDQSGTMRLAAQNKQKPGPGLHNEEGKWKRPLFRKLSNDAALFISLDNAWTESLKRERSLAALTPGVCSSGAWGFFPCCGVLSLPWGVLSLPWGSFPAVGGSFLAVGGSFPAVGFIPCRGVFPLLWGSFPVVGGSFPVVWGFSPVVGFFPCRGGRSFRVVGFFPCRGSFFFPVVWGFSSVVGFFACRGVLSLSWVFPWRCGFSGPCCEGEPRMAHGAGPAWGKAALLQHPQRAPALTLAARLSEKLPRLGAKLFSKPDPYLGAFQEAEVCRNLAASADRERVGKLGRWNRWVWVILPG